MGGRLRWGPLCLPLGGRAVTRLNPPFVSSWGGGWEGRESGQRAGRRDGAGDGLWGREGRRPRAAGRAPGASSGGSSSRLPLPGRPAAHHLPSPRRPRARCAGLAPLLLFLGLFEGERRAGRRKKRSALLVCKS